MPLLKYKISVRRKADIRLCIAFDMFNRTQIELMMQPSKLVTC
jgi:hypothetical protein